MCYSPGLVLEGDISVTINEWILTFLYNQSYRVGSKVALSFIQRLEFQTNKSFYGDEMTHSETTRGKKDHLEEREKEDTAPLTTSHQRSINSFLARPGIYCLMV